jgi:MFS family permease
MLRLLQGFAVGGEWGGAVLIVAEVAPPSQRGFWTCWPQVGAPAGNLLAAGVFALSSALLTEADFIAWGWRIPFLMSIILVVVGWWLRRAVSESMVFAREAAAGGVERFPAMEAIRRKGRALLTGAGLRFGENICYYVIATFSITYFTEIRGGDRSLVLNAVLIGSAIECLTMPLFAALSDRVGRRLVYGAGAVCVAAWFLIFFTLMDRGSMWSVSLAITVVMVAHDHRTVSDALTLLGGEHRLSGDFDPGRVAGADHRPYTLQGERRHRAGGRLCGREPDSHHFGGDRCARNAWG